MSLFSLLNFFKIAIFLNATTKLIRALAIEL